MEKTKEIISTLDITASDREKWFSEFLDALIHQVHCDKLAFDTGVATEEKTKFYNTLMGGNSDEMAKYQRELTGRHFIQKILLEYITEIINSFQESSMPVKLGLRMASSKILVWAEIKDNDEDSENALIMAEAKANAGSAKIGFHLSSTIVEEDDKLTMPPQYKDILPLLKQNA